MKEAYEKLKKSPIYAMSLGSHELFHSNFWAWMMETYKESIETVFGIPVDLNKEYSIKREYKHFDISIICNDEIYIIENKFKSIPYESQLISYQQSVEKDKKYFKGGTLICIKKPNIDNWKCIVPNGNWNCTTYERILKNMDDFADNVANSFYKQIIKEYVNVTKELLEIIEKAEKNSNGKFQLSSDCYTDFEELRLSDVLRKLNAVEFLIKCQKEIEEVENKYSLYIDSDYSNKNAILNFFLLKLKDKEQDMYSAVKKAEYEYMIGIQIQGNQYRRVYSSTSGTCQENFNKLAELKWFDANYSKRAEKTIFGKPTKMRNRFNKYNTNAYRFVYQYYNLDGESTFESVKKAVVDDLNRATEIFEKM